MVCGGRSLKRSSPILRRLPRNKFGANEKIDDWKNSLKSRNKLAKTGETSMANVTFSTKAFIVEVNDTSGALTLIDRATQRRWEPDPW